jgi:hypothetical protein
VVRNRRPFYGGEDVNGSNISLAEIKNLPKEKRQLPIHKT